MKAVVMAGGQGSRLRPITCTIPKPLVRLAGKPVLEYIFDLLIRNGVDEVCVTLGYLASVIRERYNYGQYKTLQITFSEEDIPLGTAGSVLKAAKDWNEPFLVISGDAVCDFPLDEIVRSHLSSGAEITVVGTAVEDPREYGLIEMDNDGTITSFIEKPSWNQVTTNIANTGIYVINPTVLSYVPNNESCDFAKELFPKLMSAKKAIRCEKVEGYWCDIGDVSALLQCTKDLLGGKIRFPLRKAEDGIFIKNALPQGKYKIVPPVYIGNQVEIDDGAVIGPYTSIDDDCYIGKNSRVRNSILYERVSIGNQVSLEKSLICSDASVHGKSSMFEQSVLGCRSIMQRNSTLNAKVRVWPEKVISEGKIEFENIQHNDTSQFLFDDTGIADAQEIDAKFSASLGMAIGSISSCKKVGIGFDGSNAAKIVLLALQSGLMSCGSGVWNFGECSKAELSYCTAFCGLTVGVYVSGNPVHIYLFGESGLSLPRFLDREIETRLRKGEFNRCSFERCKDIADMRSIRLMYGRELLRQAPVGLRGITAYIHCNNKRIQYQMEETLLKLGCLREKDLQFDISEDGLSVSAVLRGQLFSFESLLAICCHHAFRENKDVILPYNAPLAIENMARKLGRNVIHYLSEPTDGKDFSVRQKSAKQMYLRDGLFMTVRILAIMKEREMNLRELYEEIPEFYVESKKYYISFPPSKLGALFQDDENRDSNVAQGIAIRHDAGRFLIEPVRNGREIKVYAESAKMETAEEMCAGFEKMLSELEKI